MSQEYRVGEVVDVTIRGRIVAPMPGSDHILTIAYEQVESGEPVVVYLTRPAADTITITRVAPPEWPPRRGDVWVDRDEHAYLALGTKMLQHAVRDHPFTADYVLATFSPLRLVHRGPDGGEQS